MDDAGLHGCAAPGADPRVELIQKEGDPDEALAHVALRRLRGAHRRPRGCGGWVVRAYPSRRMRRDMRQHGVVDDPWLRQVRNHARVNGARAW